MEVLRIKANQVFSNYRKPMSYSFIDTYPLPPLSTVKGWFHNVIEAKDYIPVSMSIQGKSNFLVYDMQTLIKFDRKRSEKKQIVIEGFNKAFSQSPTFVANLYNTELIIYIASDKQHLETFKNNIFNKDYPSLGRYEDLLRIDSVDIINLDIQEIGSHDIDYGIYLSPQTADELMFEGNIIYNLPFKYETIDGLRVFKDKRKVIYTDSHNIFEVDIFYDSEYNRIVDFIGDYISHE